MENLSELIYQALDPYAGDLITQTDFVKEYVTRTGVHVLFLNPGVIWEFDTTQEAMTVSMWRFVIIDVLRLYTAIIGFRYLCLWFGVNPYGNEWIRAVYALTTPYVRLFLGSLPNIMGVDLGMILAIYLLDRIDHGILKIIIIDGAGTRF